MHDDSGALHRAIRGITTLLSPGSDRAARYPNSNPEFIPLYNSDATWLPPLGPGCDSAVVDFPFPENYEVCCVLRITYSVSCKWLCLVLYVVSSIPTLAPASPRVVAVHCRTIAISLPTVAWSATHSDSTHRMRVSVLYVCLTQPIVCLCLSCMSI